MRTLQDHSLVSNSPGYPLPIQVFQQGNRKFPADAREIFEFGNIAVHLNGEMPYQPWAAALVKKRSEGIGKDDPVALCQPAGLMRLHTYPPLRKIVQNSGLTVILSERDVTFRLGSKHSLCLDSEIQKSWNLQSPIDLKL